MANPKSPSAMVISIVISFIIAAMVNVYPLSATTAHLRPMVLMMVLIFWLIFQPRYVGVLSAFTIGILADLILDTRLGQQTFCAVLVALTIKVSSIYMRHLSSIKVWLLASLCLSIFQISLWIIQYITQNLFVNSLGSLLVSIGSFPIVMFLLRRFEQY